MYELYLETDSKTECLTKCNDITEIFQFIEHYLKGVGFKCHYYRQWLVDGKTYIDFGSYVDFFYYVKV